MALTPEETLEGLTAPQSRGRDACGWSAAGAGGGGVGQDADDHAADCVYGGVRDSGVEHSGDHVHQQSRGGDAGARASQLLKIGGAGSGGRGDGVRRFMRCARGCCGSSRSRGGSAEVVLDF